VNALRLKFDVARCRVLELEVENNDVALQMMCQLHDVVECAWHGPLDRCLQLPGTFRLALILVCCCAFPFHGVVVLFEIFDYSRWGTSHAGFYSSIVILLGIFPLFMSLCDCDRTVQAQFVVGILNPNDTLFTAKYLLTKWINSVVFELLLLRTLR